jgi:hypothetical protein
MEYETKLAIMVSSPASLVHESNAATNFWLWCTLHKRGVFAIDHHRESARQHQWSSVSDTCFGFCVSRVETA